MQQDKDDRRFHYKQKNSKKTNKSLASDVKDENKVKKEFKHKKAEMEQDELWEDWQKQYR